MNNIKLQDIHKSDIRIGDVITNIDYSYNFPKGQRVDHVASICPYYASVVDIIPVSWTAGGKDWSCDPDTGMVCTSDTPIKTCTGNILKVKWDGISHDYLYIMPSAYVSQSYYNKAVMTFISDTFTIL